MTNELAELDAIISGRVLANRYTIEELIGSGGMGVVFGGRDLRTGKSIAIKRLHTRYYGDPQMRTSMAHEVRALAQLRHPGIVGVLDFGLEGGTPYVVMERVVGRTLSAYLNAGLDWATIRSLAISMLRTLAHAHARGVVHLDLKPDNIVVLEPTFVKIVDFGFAQITEADDPSTSAPPSLRSATGAGRKRRRRVRGTLGFMAPEQAAADETRIGPASDLFAVGVVLYLLLCRRLPFKNFRLGASVGELIAIAPRPLASVIEIPPGVEAVVMELLAGDSFARGDVAADYMRRLEAIEARGTPHLPDVPPLSPARELPGDLPDVFLAPTGSWVVPSPSSVVAASLPKKAFFVNQAEEGVQDPLLSSRRELFGIREPVLSGRAAEQGWLLEPAAEVLQSGSARVRILRGAPGSGKSRLARWMLQRSREDGSFRGLSAFFGRGGADSGVRGALRDLLRGGNAPKSEIADRAMQRLGCSPLEARAIASVLSPGAKLQGQRAQQEIVVALSIALRYLARARPLLLWMDDAGASIGGGAYRVVEALLQADATEPLPIYVVATEGPDPPDEVSAAARRLESHRATRSLNLPPLDEAAVRAIALDLLPLEEPTLEALVGHASGNPLFVIHLLAHWVETGRLRRIGERLAGPGTDEIPETLADVMGARIDGIAALAGDSTAFSEIVERVALLGRRVTRSLLARAIELEGRQDLGALVEPALERWLSAGILREDAPGVLEIEQRELARLLASRARTRTTWSATHRACAAAKAEWAHGVDGDPALLREVAEHLFEAGQLESAAGEAIEAGDRLRRRGHTDASVDCLALARDCVARLESPSAQLRSRLEVAVAAAELHTGRVEVARVAAHAAVAAGRESADGFVLATALVCEGDVLRRIGATGEATARLREAFELASTDRLSEPLGRASHSLGQIHYARGELSSADELAKRAIVAGNAAGDPFVVLMAASLVRAVALARGDLDAALEGTEADRTAAEELGYPVLVAQIERHLGELAIVRGEPAKAMDHFKRQAAVLELVGDPHLSAQGHLGTSLAFAELGRSADADAAAGRAEASAEALGATLLRRDAAILRAYAAALDGAWVKAGAHLERLVGKAEEPQAMELMVARALFRVGRLSMAGGQADIARFALRRALVHLRRFGSAEVHALEVLFTPPGDATTNPIR